MHSLVNSNGILACDEQYLPAAFTYPPSNAFNKSIELVQQITKQKNLDFSFGERLYSLFHQFKLEEITLQVIQPTLTTAHQKNIWPLFFIESKKAFLEAGIITENDLDEMLKGLIGIANDQNSYILPMRNFQIWGKNWSKN